MTTPSTSADPHTVPTSWWHQLDDGRIQCDVCPRACKLREGQRGVCFVRGRSDDQIVLTSYGRSSGLCIDPIEKKPLNHFLPGTAVLSLGTAGCNLACRFCQNWDISKSKDVDRLSSVAWPESIAQEARRLGCASVAFTYNDPVIFTEYAVDTARACREVGVASVAVSAGYVCDEPRRALYSEMDAVNIDLKAFDDDFYRHVAMGSLAPVLDTLRYIHHETDAWLEVTTLVIPGHNDSVDELDQLSGWIADELGPEVPLHFSAFHPDYRMLDVASTPVETLRSARRLARANGLQYVYTGNVHDPEGDATPCAGCGATLVQRDRYDIVAWHLDDNGACTECGRQLEGVVHGPPGDWGRRRQPVRLRRRSR
ncbi:MAG: AmmeMemoRadiSam system radical SAM enzyme [Acidimicrobiia bacterium]|nr:AmmeMemoRadiSam system radical SAM enzyme [Acidimicrobiia bacterium]